ncbi:hypothetical protein J6590_062355 [Homalodisca vitripennis]|nr:hypothetical protein J6590_062355 [Homalodisca vitripennis]
MVEKFQRVDDVDARDARHLTIDSRRDRERAYIYVRQLAWVLQVQRYNCTGSCTLYGNRTPPRHYAFGLCNTALVFGINRPSARHTPLTAHEMTLLCQQSTVRITYQ